MLLLFGFYKAMHAFCIVIWLKSRVLLAVCLLNTVVIIVIALLRMQLITMKNVLFDDEASSIGHIRDINYVNLTIKRFMLSL